MGTSTWQGGNPEVCQYKMPLFWDANTYHSGTTRHLAHSFARIGTILSSPNLSQQSLNTPGHHRLIFSRLSQASVKFHHAIHAEVTVRWAISAAHILKENPLSLIWSIVWHNALHAKSNNTGTGAPEGKGRGRTTKSTKDQDLRRGSTVQARHEGKATTEPSLALSAEDVPYSSNPKLCSG